MGKEVYGTSNAMVWNYFGIARRVASELKSISDKDRLHQDICICILLSVTAVETFLNIFFQNVVCDPIYQKHKEYISDCLSNRKSLNYKIENWPKDIFGKTMDTSKGIGKDFSELREKRNQLMHFTSNKDITIDGITLHNFSIISFYESLKPSDAYDAIQTAQDFIAEILIMSGLTGSDLNAKTLYWFGRPHA